MSQTNLPDTTVATLSAIAMPKDTNPAGDIFGGWIMSQMDLAGSAHVRPIVKGNVVTVAVDAMTFHQPVFVGDHVSSYCEVVKVGRTSITVHIETWVRRRDRMHEQIKVIEGNFVYVHIDDKRQPTTIKIDPEDLK